MYQAPTKPSFRRPSFRTFLKKLFFWRKRSADELLLNSLFVSEQKWEAEGLIESRNSASQDQKKELTAHHHH
jgi:hypothetical protein